MKKSNIKNSKKLTWILRHGDPNATGVKIRTDGFALVEDVLEKFDNLSLKELINIVDNDEKSRFKLVNEDGKLFIRANQGHSLSFIESEKLLSKVDSKSLKKMKEKIVMHGTKLSKWENIKNTGLSKMSRSHIHFFSASNFKIVNKHQRYKDIDLNMKLDQVINKLCDYKFQAGIRPSSNVVIFIDITNPNFSKNGIEFFVSSNGVILSSGNDKGVIDSSMFLLCIDIEHGIELMNNTSNIYSNELVKLIVDSIIIPA
ncbi:hypothetical protein FG386_001763 [Cryptosporidium ryanae]|uniref:uncharacterized protein n=1 Tax=Cryptosporidium ryanae TaxID=515981 RepID=UPI00351A1DCD|nr:hypothetical protein FG386_001763 [Cryptosporidium ryanae]